MSSISADPLDYECPKCNARRHYRCRSLTSGRTTDTHAARFHLAGKALMTGWTR